MRIARSLLVLLLALLVAGCGGDEGSDDDGGAADSSSDRTEEASDDGDELAARVEAELRVRLDQVGGKSSDTGITAPTGITCDRKIPATCRGEVACPGDDPELCAWLARPQIQELLLEEPAKDEICTEIHGGPEVATVTGTIGERAVRRTFSRTNGCEINRFDMAAPLWTGEVPPPVDPSGSAGGAAGTCLADTERGPEAPVSSDDPICNDTPELEPEVIDDPPEAFEPKG